MSLRNVLAIWILVAGSAILGLSAANAQLPKHVERCLPYPTYAQEVDTMYSGKPVAQNKVIVIDSVEFDGPVTLPAQNKQKLIDDLKRLEPDADSRWLEEVEEAPIRGAWQDDGYFTAAVSLTARELGSDAVRQHVALMVHVDEGLQYVQGRLQFTSADADNPLVFSFAELRNLYPLREGDVFDAEKIRESLNAYRRLYAAHGYIDFSSTPDFDVDDKTGRVNLTIEMDQQKQFRIDAVDVSGLDPRTEGILRSLVKPGGVFNSDVIDKFFDENRSLLPAGSSPQDNLTAKRNVKAGTTSLRFDFFTCPESSN
jgi:outer membrane protein assembly factor BamA